MAGIVLNSATNVGIPRALVSYMGPSAGYRFTDAGGNFQVNVPCGSYSLSASKPGFVSGQELTPRMSLLFNAQLESLNAESSDQPARPPDPANLTVDLEPGSRPTQISLVPVSSIAGTVLDENSEPLGGVTVQGLAVKASLTGTDYVPAQTARTDDRGHYSILSLTPGDYVVRLAGEASSTRYFIGTTLNPNNDHRGMQPLYFPNADAPSSASVFHLLPGERANADFRHATEAAFDINGRLTGFVPQDWTQLQLYRDGDRLPVAGAFVNQATGQFRVVDVPRGSYTLRAVQYQTDTPQWLAAEVPVTVTSEPIRNLIVQLSIGVDIPVSVSYEAGAQNGGAVSLMLMPQHAVTNVRRLTSAPTSPQPQVFTNVISDKYKLSAQVFGSNYLASAKLGDVDALHGEFPAGGSAAKLHVTIRGDSATLQGQVSFEGKPAAGAQVYLISPTGGATGFKFGSCNQEGHFKIIGVPPGDYRIQAWTGSPTAKEILSGAGETLTVQPSEQRTVTLEAAPSIEPSRRGGRPPL